MKYGGIEKMDVKEFRACRVEKAPPNVIRDHVRARSGKKCPVTDGWVKERVGRTVVECIMVMCVSRN